MRTDHLFLPSLRNTLYFTVISVPLTMVFSLSLALLLNNKIKGRSIFRSIMFFPHVASLIAMAAVWNQIFHPSWGPVNQLINFFGVENAPRWTVTPWVIPNIAFFTTWRNMGYFMIIYLAGLQGIPQELYEAASIDGAGRFKKFIFITLPQLRFVTFFVTVMLTIMSFRVFDQVLMITNTERPGSGSTMMVVHIFRVAFVDWNMGYASAIAVVLLALVLSITIVQFIIQKRRT
jgi:multiple sugar transport system permease protein